MLYTITKNQILVLVDMFWIIRSLDYDFVYFVEELTMICDYHSRLHAIASYLGMHSSTTKSREVSMNDENGGNDEDGEDHCDEINRDTEAERIGSNLAKRMRLIKES